ncbi:MAG: tetratricopeptide repeat protein [Chitinophagaceae bacterium]|nr:tetratricopeptide repeat protein [Chitinophagaceae bacterium]
MLLANDSTVYGNFNNAVLSADGVTSRFFKKDGKFFINTQGEDGKYYDYEVKYVFGFTPLQQYLIEFPGGRMQSTRASWDTKNKKWFHQYAGQKIPAGDWLHWTGNGQNWNTMCASCHSTNVQKGYDQVSDTYKTTFNEVNVTCESCHGPGKLHIDYINSSNYKTDKKLAGSMLHMTKAEGQIQQVNTCGYCHARRADITGAVLPGREFMNDFIAELPTNTFFFADGQMNDEDYNYTSFLESRMYHRGVMCSNCHNPHSGNLKLEGSKVCSQCHAPAKYNLPTHTMHAESSEGSSCINCHMPSKIYMGVDLRHDHSFRIPRPDLTVKYGTPNTCNSCHKDKTATWAAQSIEKNFGAVRKYHFAEDLIPGSQLNANSEAHLSKLAGDTAVPNIVRATALDYISRLNTENSGPILLKYLSDTSADVRYRSLKGLFGYDPALWINAAAPLLQDKVLAVRIAAAELFTTLPDNQVPTSYMNAFSNSRSEYERFIIYQTDFAQGNVQAGDYYRRLHDLDAAEKFYTIAIAKDNLLAIARVNLASTLNERGKNEEALQQLLEAQKAEPASDVIYYNLALLYVELKQPEAAQKAFQKAIDLHSVNIRVYYNYALFLQQAGKAPEAEKIFLQALKINPTDGDVLYAITILYMQQNNIPKAQETARMLKQYHAGNANYQALLQQMQI